jgi:hypothetical protein
MFSTLNLILFVAAVALQFFVVPMLFRINTLREAESDASFVFEGFRNAMHVFAVAYLGFVGWAGIHTISTSAFLLALIASALSVIATTLMLTKLKQMHQTGWRPKRSGIGGGSGDIASMPA